MEELRPCSVCARIPLVGEEVTVVVAPRGRGRDGAAAPESMICDLCLCKPRAAALGEPIRRERVRSAAGAASVRRVFPRPVQPAERRGARPAPAL